MKHDEVVFDIFLREPKYPLIVISKDQLMSAFDIDELAYYCINAELMDGETTIKAIDSTGEEFWYTPKYYVISPGFGFVLGRWSKTRIIQLYNSFDCNKVKYSKKSLSAKRLERIILDICNLLKS